MSRAANRWITVLLIGFFLLVSSGVRAWGGWWGDWYDNYFVFPFTGYGSGYPACVYTGFSGRFGEKYFGWGLYGNVGISFGPYKTGSAYPTIYLNGGAKFYPKGQFYLAAGFGTLGTKHFETKSEPDGKWTLAGPYMRRGVELLVGYDIVFGSSSDDVRFLMLPSIGCGYDPWIGEFTGFFRLTLGLGFTFD